jgi:hypothetical protein
MRGSKLLLSPPVPISAQAPTRGVRLYYCVFPPEPAPSNSGVPEPPEFSNDVWSVMVHPKAIDSVNDMPLYGAESA